MKWEREATPGSAWWGMKRGRTVWIAMSGGSSMFYEALCSTVGFMCITFIILRTSLVGIIPVLMNLPSVLF